MIALPRFLRPALEGPSRERADLYTPPLTPAGHAWRTALVLLLGSGVVIGAVGSDPSPLSAPSAVVALDLAIGLVALGLSFLRRRWPFPIALAVTACGAVSVSSAAPGLLVGVSLATRRVAWQLEVVGLLGIAATMVLRVVQPATGMGTPWWGDLVVAFVVTAAMFGWGLYIGSRRELLWTLRDRAERAEAVQELRFSQGRANERARIAREMHDVLAHRISLITMHAGALTYRTDLTPEQVRTTAEVIQTASQEALADLRLVLGVLRGDQANASEFADRPQPTFADLRSLVEEVRASGMRVRFTQDVAAGEDLPDVVGRTAYRVVQESLTNARKHAPGTAVEVTVSGSAQDGVRILVTNPAHALVPAPAAPPSGLGLVGLRERVALGGGTLRTGVRDGRFEVEALLPWTAGQA